LKHNLKSRENDRRKRTRKTRGKRGRDLMIVVQGALPPQEVVRAAAIAMIMKPS
jgi:hypothetical protein